MPMLPKLAAPLMVAAVLSTIAAPAMAWERDHHHMDRGDVAAAGVIGLIGGAILGSALASPPPPPVYYEPSYEPAPPPPVYYRPAPVVVYQPAPQPVYAAQPVDSQHAAWCAGRYRSYNAYDNTWIDNHGRLRPCQSPYYGG